MVLSRPGVPGGLCMRRWAPWAPWNIRPRRGRGVSWIFDRENRPGQHGKTGGRAGAAHRISPTLGSWRLLSRLCVETQEDKPQGHWLRGSSLSAPTRGPRPTPPHHASLPPGAAAEGPVDCGHPLATRPPRSERLWHPQAGGWGWAAGSPTHIPTSEHPVGAEGLEGFPGAPL